MADDSWNGSCSDLALLSRNSTSEIWRLPSPRDDAKPLAIIAALTIYLIVGLAWNILIMVAIIRDSFYKKATHIILLNLVIADILLCAIFGIIDGVLAVYRDYKFGSSDYERCFFCKASITAVLTLGFSTGFSLMFMSLDRLIYVKWPMKYVKIVTVKRVSTVLLMSWALSILFCFPLMLGIGEVQVFKYSFCDLNYQESILYGSILSVPILVLLFLILSSNAWIIIILLKNRRKKMQRDLDHYKSTETISEHSKHIKEYNKTYYKDQLSLSVGFGAIIVVTITVWVIIGLLTMATFVIEEGSISIIITAIYFIDYLAPILHSLIETCFIPRGRKLLLNTLCSCQGREKHEYSS